MGRELTDEEAARLFRKFQTEKAIRERDALMDEIERQSAEQFRHEPKMQEGKESLRNPDGSLNAAAIYRKFNRAGRKRA